MNDLTPPCEPNVIHLTDPAEDATGAWCGAKDTQIREDDTRGVCQVCHIEIMKSLRRRWRDDLETGIADADAIQRIRDLHYPADNDGPRTPRCEHCHGKAGVHPCGCWAERDRQPVCGECNGRYRAQSVPWPCPTIRALEAPDE